MEDLDQGRVKELIEHIMGCRTHTNQFPKELLELEDYLRQLTLYVERFRKLRDSIMRVPLTELRKDGVAEGPQLTGLKEAGGRASVVMERVSSTVRASVRQEGDSAKAGRLTPEREPSQTISIKHSNTVIAEKGSSPQTASRRGSGMMDRVPSKTISIKHGSRTYVAEIPTSPPQAVSKRASGVMDSNPASSVPQPASRRGSAVMDRVPSKTISIKHGSRTYVAEIPGSPSPQAAAKRASVGSMRREESGHIRPGHGGTSSPNIPSRASVAQKKPSSAGAALPGSAEKRDRQDVPPDGVETSFSVREDQQQPLRAEVIEMPAQEETAVIDYVEIPEAEPKKDEEEARAETEEELYEEAEAQGEAEQAKAEQAQVLASDSKVGVYSIDEVNPVKLLEVIQRELDHLGVLCPPSKCIVSEITKEFDHFKVCCTCLKKVAVLLPEILKEIQELIRFVKKRRNEPYIWPNDLDFLRKAIDGSKTKEAAKSQNRKETVGYMTVEIPRTLRTVQGTSQYLRKYSVQMINRPVISLLHKEAQSELRVMQKLEVFEPQMEERIINAQVFYPTEYSCLQFLLFLRANPVFETVMQFHPDESKKFLERDVDGESIGRDLNTGMRDLKDLMLDVHNSQMELHRILLRDSNPVHERTVIAEVEQVDSRGSESIQLDVSSLKSACLTKSSVVTSLVKGLCSALLKQRSDEATLLLQQLQDLHAGISDYQWNTVTPQEVGKQFHLEEISSEGEIMKMAYARRLNSPRDCTRVCFSEIIAKNPMSPSNNSSVTGNRPSCSYTGEDQSENAFQGKGNETCSSMSVQTRWFATEELQKKTDSAGATINVTIKIGEDDSGIRYSTLSSEPSGVVLQGKKSEMFFLLNGNGLQAPKAHPLQEMVSEVNVPAPVEEGKTSYKIKKAVKKDKPSTIALKFKLPASLQDKAKTAAKERTDSPKIGLRRSKDAERNLTVNETILDLPVSQQTVGRSLSFMNLQSRIRDAEERLESLKHCADRADLLADKLLSDAYESVDNFKDMTNRYVLLLEQLNRSIEPLQVHKMMTMVKSSEGVSPSPSGKIKKVTLVRRMLKNSVPSDPTVNPDPAENIWLVSRDVYDDTVCDGEWTKLVNSLRLAGDNIQNIRFTNSYVHEKLKECFEEIESIKKMSAVSDAQLGRLSELDVAFSEAVSKKLSDVDLKKYGKIVTFGKLPRRSKSAECSFHRVFATREVRERQDIRRYKINRKQEYGKYCSSCGAVEVSCMQNAMRCWECDGEIVIPGLCSSCDSLKTKPPKGKIQEKRFIDRACSTCNFIRRKRLSLHEKKPCCKCKRMKKLPKDYEKAGRLMKVMPDSSCCSDCDYTSSCDVPHSYPSGESVSTDRDHVMSMHPFSHDYDMSCSVSSSMSEVPKEYGKHTPPATVQSVHELSRVQEEPIEEEFTTPRESMSVEETAAPMTEDGPYLSVPESDTDSQTNWSDEEYQDPVGGTTNLPEDKPPPLQLSLLKDLAAKPPVTEVCERMHSAEIALGCLVSGNAKLEEQISTMENISQQNLKLSAILREIMVGMTNHLDVIQQQMEEESEGSDEFEEAVEELHFPETDSIVSEESRVLCAGCLLKKTDDSGVVCQGKIGDALGTVARKECTEKMSGLTVSLPMKLDQKHYPLSTLEWKLKELERETTTLKNNNEFINMFISELQNKLSAEVLPEMLNRMKCLNTREASSGESSSESTIVGFDVSVYQVTTTVTEKSCKEPAIEDTFREETQQKRNFMQMKIEEVFKKEQQRAYEVEVFHQKLEVEGLIIKEREEFYTCSNCSQLTDRIDDFRTIPLALMKGYNPEKLQTLKDVNARGDRENDELLISIEIEVEKEKKSATKKSLRCEYKKSMQREERLPEYDKKLQMLTLYPLWPTKGHQSRNRQLSHPESVPDLKKLINEDASDGVRSIFRMDSDFSTEGMYFIDLERDDFVEIKPPDYSYRSSDEESECCAGDYVQEKKRKKMNAIAAMTMPIPLWTVMEIDVPPTPLAVLNMKDRTCRKREFGRISQIELEEAPVSGVVLVQTQAVASVGLIDSGTGVNVPHRKFPVHHEKQSRFRGGHSSPKRCHASLVYFSPLDEVERAVQEIDPSTEEMSVFVIDATPQEEFSDCLPEPEASLRPELSTAMDLIREIESDVAEVKLDKAIAILPRLESVLREHIQDKMKVLRKRSSTVTNSSLDVFMSTLTFLTDDAEPPSAVDSESEERLRKMLNLMTGLEDAVRDIAANVECPGDNAGRIYELLRSLSNRIKDTTDEPDIAQMEKTLELTSELDVAVRQYSSELESFRTPSASEIKIPIAHSSDDPEDDSVLAENLRSMKTRIYEVVEKETQEREQRMEKNLDRIARLEEENSEVMNFLDTLLDKTLTRVNELDNVRTSAYDLSEIATELICILEKVKREEELERNVERAAAAAAATATASAAEDAKKGGCRKREESPTRTVKIHPDALQGDSRRQANRTREQGVPSTASPGETEGSPPRTPKVVRRPTLPSIAEVSSDKASGESSEDDRFRNPFTNMMATLDKLKSRAKEKKQKCDEIFGKKETREEPSMIKQVERVGSNSCYVTWKKPSEDTEAIVGYEICVNGKVNQRVRNPERLKAVLCLAGTQPPTEPINIELFALTKDSRKRSIGRAIHSWESTRAPRYTTL